MDIFIFSGNKLSTSLNVGYYKTIETKMSYTYSFDWRFISEGIVETSKILLQDAFYQNSSYEKYYRRDRW
jgi:hypothetical protein